MDLINFKQSDCEEILIKKSFSKQEIENIKKDMAHYEEYYLTNSGMVKIFQQEFISDPHMDLPPLKKIRLVNYPKKIDKEELEEIFTKEEVPIITRAFEDKPLPNFHPILNKEGKKTKLIPIKLPIVEIPSSSAFVYTMTNNDVLEIEELLKKEYSLRYKMVQLMYEDCPEACFIYRAKGKTLGVSFNKIDGNGLYMRQIFVKSGQRGKGVGKALYNARLHFAWLKQLSIAKANIRIETLNFHEKYDARASKKSEYYVIRGI